MSISQLFFVNQPERKSRITVLIKLALFFNLFYSVYIFRGAIDIYLGYFFILALLPFFVYKFGIPTKVAIVFVVLFLVGSFYSFIDLNVFGVFFKVFMGVLTSYLFFYYLVNSFDYSSLDYFKFYLEFGFYSVLFGFFQLVAYLLGFENGKGLPWLFGLINSPTGGSFGIRINSFLGEPTHFMIFLSGVYFVAIHDLLFWQKPYFFGKTAALIVLISLYSSFSGMLLISTLLAFVAIGLYYGISRLILIIIPISFFSLTQLINSSKEFEGRFSGTQNIFFDAPQSEIDVFSYHGSSIVLYNNFHIAVENFKRNPIFGTGLGSHSVAFDKYSLTKNAEVEGFDLNKKDANSMFNRLLSETGLFGLLLVSFIIIRFFPSYKWNKQTWLISTSCLLIILLNLSRQGHYFLNGFPFYFWLYILAFKERNLLENEN